MKGAKADTLVADAYWFDVASNSKVFGLEKDSMYKLSFRIKLKEGTKATEEHKDMLTFKGGLLSFEDIPFADKVGSDWVEISVNAVCTVEPDNNSGNGGTGTYFSINSKVYNELKDSVYLIDEFSIEKTE